MQRMTDQEYRRFLAERPRTAKGAAVRANGAAHVAPVWITMHGDAISFTTGGSHPCRH